MQRQDVKVVGEEAAARFLEAHGLTVIARNWRLKMGELDIVAREGSTLIFVEVKTRQSASFIDPSAAVDWRKQRKLRRLAEAFIAFQRPDFETCRFDVVSVIYDGTARIDHIPSAF